MSDFQPGETLFVDRIRAVEFVRYSGARAIVKVGHDPVTIDPAHLTREEA